MDHRIINYVEDHPGCDAEDIARDLGIGLWLAVARTDRLLKRGALEFADQLGSIRLPAEKS